MKKKPTIKDIAKLARVSPPAVSMALRGHTRISEKTRQRIGRIARKLNYHPNFVARSLVVKRTNTLGLIITSIRNPFYPELAKKIDDTARQHGYNIILCNTNYDLKLEKYFIDILRSKGVDGIIFSSVEAKDANIKPLVEDGFPFVLINRRTHHRLLNRKTPYIGLNNFSGGWMAMDHLYKMGHRCIGMVTGDFRVSTAIERLEGAKAFLNHVGLELEARLLMEAHFSMEGAYRAAKRLICLRSPPTAIFAQNDYMALGVREAVMESGLRIPEDMGLMGCDNISISGLRGIELTTIGQTKYDMGTLAVEMLVDRIEKAGARKAEQILLEPELIIRKSCGFALYGYQARTMADRGTSGYLRGPGDRGTSWNVSVT